MACLGLVTFFPLRPDFRRPRLNSCISRFTSLPAEGEYFRRDDDLLEAFFEADFLPEDFFAADLLRVVLFFVLLLLRELDVFFALLFLVLLFFALVLLRALDFFAFEDFFVLEDFFVPDDFFALVDFFLAAFFVAITILPPTEMISRFGTVVSNSGNPQRFCKQRKARRRMFRLGAHA